MGYTKENCNWLTSLCFYRDSKYTDFDELLENIGKPVGSKH